MYVFICKTPNHGKMRINHKILTFCFFYGKTMIVKTKQEVMHSSVRRYKKRVALCKQDLDDVREVHM
jgi:hypothetical protein